MFFHNYYTYLDGGVSVNKIEPYKKIMDKFIIAFISIFKSKYFCSNEKNKLYEDSIIYSKYYLYWKIYGCVYKKEIMDILYDVEFSNCNIMD
mgnify:CR=1 FL=1